MLNLGNCRLTVVYCWTTLQWLITNLFRNCIFCCRACVHFVTMAVTACWTIGHQGLQPSSIDSPGLASRYGAGFSSWFFLSVAFTKLFCFPCSHHVCWHQRHCSRAACPCIPSSSHTQGSFCIVALQSEVHRQRCEIVGRLPSKGDTALLLSHSVIPVLTEQWTKLLSGKETCNLGKCYWLI